MTAVSPAVRRARLAVALVVALSGASTAQAPPEAIRVAVLHEGDVLCLREDGRLRVWNSVTLKARPSAPVAALPEGARELATGEGGLGLWCSTRDALWRWSAPDQTWSKAADFDAHGEASQGLAVVGGYPHIVLGHRVTSPLEHREFPVPKGAGQLGPERILRVSAVVAGPGDLWIGTDNGEWGGELYGLDVATGAWVQSLDDLHEVTGLAISGPEEVTATWSSAHMQFATLVRVHGTDGKVRSESAELDERYDQGLAWSAFDKRLYDADTGRLITFRDGERTEHARLPAGESVDGRLAAFPGDIVAILPFAPGAVVVVPAIGAPWRWSGKLERFPEP